ncbi:MAG: ExbD/TolR family protein [Hoylesella buccalis]
MLIRKRRHDIPGLNTTSTADISFMLLIFFLVTTSMDVDKGLRRQLPPAQQEKIEQESLVDKGKLMELENNRRQCVAAQRTAHQHGRIAYQNGGIHHKSGQRASHIDKRITRVGIQKPGFNLQNELMAAYKNVRNRLARQRYGQPLEACNEAQRNGILEQCPQRIAETYQTSEEGASHD